MARTFYRIIATASPSLNDFLSDRTKGKRAPVDPARRDLYDGLSVYATLAQARRKALDLPMLGGHLAELRHPDQASVRVERTVRSSRGHHTLWAAPENLLSLVVAVIPVEQEVRDGI